MSQFDFIKSEWPSVYVQAEKAERYALNDARAACFQARLALEVLVGWVYDHERDLRRPYDTTLAALISEPSFKKLAGGVSQKAYLIKNNGNKAVHSKAAVSELKALSSVRELHHVCYWLARSYSRSGPPQNIQFDAGKLPRLTHVEPQKLAVLQQAADKWVEIVKERDRAKADAVQSEFEAKAAKQEVERLQAEIAAIKSANISTADTHDYNEAQTRTDLIDVLLEEAGWDLDAPNVREYEVSGMPSTSGIGFADYVLWGENGKPLAVVEAKRSRLDMKTGERQAELYADCLETQFKQRPIIFCTNGFEHEIWDDAIYPPRPIAGFLKQDELQTLINRRSTRKPTASIPVNPEISGRYYQERAIRKICEHFETDKQRKALLVMATGSGKTRVSISLTDVLMRAGWTKRILFLADRTALVKQAANAFKEHLPSSSPVNLLADKDAMGRVYLSTYPTMLNLINKERDGKTVKFGPGHFDLIIIDEAHRSVYKKFGAIFEYFDSLLVGLTATPKDDVDRDTYRLFDLESGVPTDAYDLDNAVDDGFLVPPRAFSVPLAIPRSGLKYDELSEDDKAQWDAIEWGEGEAPPDEVSASAVNKWLFNEDTIDKVLEHLMTKGIRVDDGDKLGKTIIFAKNSAHASFIKERFDANYPHLVAGKFARKIDYSVKYAQSLIDDFTLTNRLPQIAISVDMLDTGIDVPDVVNLVFFKIVRSKTKFWQMIGRGTRLRPDLFGSGKDKTQFMVFDYCQNFEFFNENPDMADSSSARSLGHSLFLARLNVITEMDAGQQGADLMEEGEVFDDGLTKINLRRSLADRLHEEVCEMPLENFIVRPKRRYIEDFLPRASWNTISLDGQQNLREHLSNLPTQLVDNDIDAKRFDLLILRAQLALLRDSVAIENYRVKITAIASALETTDVPMVKKEIALILDIQAEIYWENITPEILEEARRKLRYLTRLIDHKARNIVYSDFDDVIGEAVEVEIMQTQVGFNRERFTAKAKHFLEAHMNHIAIHKIHTNVPLTPMDLKELERILTKQDFYADDANELILKSGGLTMFVRRLIGLDKGAAKEIFAEFIRENDLNADQIVFVDMIVDALCQNGIVSPAQLYEQPFTRLSNSGLSGLFGSESSTKIVSLVQGMNAQAVG